MVKVKICGITNLEDAKEAVKAGADALGFVFYKKSPRYIRPEEACLIIHSLPKKVKKVGVFAKSRKETIENIADICRLDMIQLHSGESVEVCKGLGKYKIIKSFRVNGNLVKDKIKSYPAFAYLFDSFDKAKLGGTGKQFNWKEAKVICSLNRPVFISGGLSEKNVAKAINTFHPAWVDVSSAVEKRPGKKDIKKVKRFIKAAKKRRNKG